MPSFHHCFSLFVFATVLRGVRGPVAEIGEEEERSKVHGYKRYVGEQQYRLPFKTLISEPFKEGQTIHAVGTVAQDPSRVDLNFHKGANPNDDMPLHLSARFDQGLIVYNSFVNGNWSPEEQQISSPYSAGKEFDIRIRLLGGKYLVFASRREAGVFEQRQPLNGVNHVSIVGSLANLTVFHYGGTIFPNPYYAIARLTPGKRLDISALSTGKRTNINLLRRSGEYALHVSIRYNEGAVVRNAMNNQMWGEEEREGGFPLNKHEIFDITIVNEDEGFVILLNGKHFAKFAHRGSASDIETLEIDGNSELFTVTINDA